MVQSWRQALNKFLARLFRGKNKEEWESMLDKLKNFTPLEVYQVMKLIYDGLDHKEQTRFFHTSNIMMNVGELKSLSKYNESDTSVFYGLERLKDKALITFSEDNYVSMHGTLQEMAWEIVWRV
ncbi:hypothetical protein JHK86_024195 [Glycine max]|nr:hypothetical protein JHK86_024195 [Glycine max]